ncbi:MAG: ATP-binding protein [Fimbriimonadales bacterium]|jgi:two-component system phosphate regulon sensor histidine kinase PhoR|nr:ATP-binding protein [Fimbriimonadales bacterium]CUU02032.1 two-component system, OmpR family, phosphate regulon sensor histidine kinase PhoR [Armatimonadetes bacterium GBS]CUU35674.1 two-component system, OmpR family, phosphate regulon sensor histidine kinase PhoR [Armatimonadetes bacterium GXS]CUU38490.1 two-component system, OmpR family, phosphate regulon sensor histidine kinase PhoR [Armatimonadetes bacterium DC]GBC89644.1 Alkaline phosphatase synthesis sensor protein PhoR [bacterium HR14
MNWEQAYRELLKQYNQVKTEYERTLERLRELEAQSKNGAKGAASGTPEVVTAEVANPANYEATLKRLVRQIGAIVQAEKVVFMLYDPEEGELRAYPPAFGLTDDEIKMLRVRATQGVSGEVFREGKPIIVHDAISDPRTTKELVAMLHVRNLVCVPLVLEKRDEENRVIDRQTIGVLHAFNKQRGGHFIDEDVRLLERMSRNAAAVIAGMRLYQAILEEKEELVHTIESLRAGLLLVNQNGRINQMNAAARRVFGLGPDVLGKPYQEVISIDVIRNMIRQALEEEKEGELVEITVHYDNKEHIYQVQNAIVRGEDQKPMGTVMIFNDITDIRNLERMKSAFVATVSHELRTPLTAIKGFISTLLMDSEDAFSPEERREFYSIIDQETDRLTRLINDLLNIARIEAGESLKPVFKEVDFYRLSQKVVMIQRQATNKHTIIHDVPPDLPKIIADEDKVDQILTNLLSNAIKYSPNGGEIRVKAWEEDPDHIIFYVSDQGMGIPKEHLTKVFEKFHRVDNTDTRKQYGTGLGLYLVKHLVEVIHGGQIWVESEVGVGSTFYVRLPKVPPAVKEGKEQVEK